jgi:hypothetical protein
LIISKSGNGTGTVTSDPAGINCGSDCSESYDIATQVTLHAAADTGVFTGWSGGGCSGTGDCIVSIDGDLSVTAEFQIQTPVSTTTTTVRPTTTTTTVPPTIVSLIDFNAMPGNRIVTLVWSIESEIDNAGFNLYRSESENGEYSKINISLIPAKGSSTEGASYEFIDTDVKNRKTYYYKLEDIDLNGTSTMHGPVSATPRWLLGINSIFRK